MPLDMIDIVRLLRDAESYLVERGVPNARRNTEWMLAHVLGCSSAELYLNPHRVIDRGALDAFHGLVRRRGEREPLQYILESTEFMSLPFHVRRGVFIPRPDTEVLVEIAEALITRLPRRSPKGNGGGISLLDLCCGTGVIGISLVHRIPQARCTAVDIDPGAVALARENAALCGVEDRVLCMEVDATVFLRDRVGEYDAVVCNPPYVPSGDIEGLLPELRDHEPVIGLDGGADGLRFYRELLPLVPRATVPGGIVAFEIGDTQAEAVTAIVQSASFSDIAVHRDYRNLDRVVTARRP
jgi:release factor glutamine methyltransferase